MKDQLSTINFVSFLIFNFSYLFQTLDSNTRYIQNFVANNTTSKIQKNKPTFIVCRLNNLTLISTLHTVCFYPIHLHQQTHNQWMQAQ